VISLYSCNVGIARTFADKRMRAGIGLVGCKAVSVTRRRRVVQAEVSIFHDEIPDIESLVLAVILIVPASGSIVISEANHYRIARVAVLIVP